MNSTELIIAKIKSYYKKKIKYTIFAGLINTLLFLLIVWICIFIADMTFLFSHTSRFYLLLFVIIFSIFVLYLNVFDPFFKFVRSNFFSNLTDITREIGDNFLIVSDKLTNIYQLITGKIQKDSSRIRDYAVEKYYNEIRQIDFNKHIILKKYLIPFSLIFIISLSSLLSIILMYDAFKLSSLRILNPYVDYNIEPAYFFKVFPGDTNIISGSRLIVSAEYKGPDLNNCVLKYKYKNQDSYQFKKMIKKNNRYNIYIESIKKPIEYFIQGIPRISAEWRENIFSNKYHISILYPPYISDLQIKVFPPGYTNLPAKFIEKNIGDILAYKGSKVKIEAAVNKELSGANIVFDDGVEIPLKIRGTRLNAEFRVVKDIDYHFKLIDLNRLMNQAPIEYTITVLEDLPPSVEIIEPGEDIELAPDAAVNLLIEGNDDFGFQELNLYYQIYNSIVELNDSTWYRVSIPIFISGNKYFQESYLWDFASLAVSFDDAVKYYVTLSDNDKVTGPKISKSTTYYIRFPSLNQIYEEFSDKQDENIKELEEIIKKSENIDEKLQRMNRELMREDKLNWEQRRKLESSFEEQKKIQRELEEIERELDKNIESLDNNRLISIELLQKYYQLHELFKELSTPEILEKIEQIKTLFEQVKPKNMDIQVKNFHKYQRQLLDKLDRVLELFKKVKIDQELDRLVQMAKKLTEEQNDISEQLNSQENSDLENMERLEVRESIQKNILDNLSQSIDSLSKNNMIHTFNKTQRLLENSYDYINENKIYDGMESLQTLLRSGQKNISLNKSNEISEDLNKLYGKLKQAQNSMTSFQKEKISAKMLKSIEDLISLSLAQENLTARTQRLSNLSNKFRDIASEQYNIGEDMDQVIKGLIDLSKETFFLSSELNTSLAKVDNNMKQSIYALEERNKNKAKKHQTLSMAALNQSAMIVQDAMEKMLNSSSALGFEEFLQQMQNMVSKQCKLNQDSFNFYQGQDKSGQLTFEEQSQLQRLAAEQEAIRKSMQQLYDETGSRRDILGRMDKIAEDMDEVVKDMKSFKMDKTTIERQQKILSRMLDSQKSLQEKEYSNKRIAEIGKKYNRKSPRENYESVDKIMERLNNDLIKALQEGYSPDYEKLIEIYFKKFNKSDIEN